MNTNDQIQKSYVRRRKRKKIFRKCYYGLVVERGRHTVRIQFFKRKKTLEFSAVCLNFECSNGETLQSLEYSENFVALKAERTF